MPSTTMNCTQEPSIPRTRSCAISEIYSWRGRERSKNSRTTQFRGNNGVFSHCSECWPHWSQDTCDQLGSKVGKCIMQHESLSNAWYLTFLSSVRDGQRQTAATYWDDQRGDPAGEAGEHPAQVKHPHILRRHDDGEAEHERQGAEHQTELPADLPHHPATQQASQRRSQRHHRLKHRRRDRGLTVACFLDLDVAHT